MGWLWAGLDVLAFLDAEKSFLTFEGEEYIFNGTIQLPRVPLARELSS